MDANYGKVVVDALQNVGAIMAPKPSYDELKTSGEVRGPAPPARQDQKFSKIKTFKI